MTTPLPGPPGPLPSPPGPPPGGPFLPLLGVPVAQNSILIGVTTMLLVLCIAAVSMRLLARNMRRVGLGIDDYMALVSLVRETFSHSAGLLNSA